MSLSISNKYKLVLNKILLGIYLIFLFSAVFHSHSIDYQSAVKLRNCIPISNLSDPFLDGKSNCLLLSFVQSQFIDLNKISVSSNWLSSNKNFIPLNSIIYSTAPFLESLNYRGPPASDS